MISKLKVYLVGGAVRDMLMGITAKDRDWVVVGSTPQEMLDLGFSQVGKDFPVFLHPETKEEYALARTERKVSLGHTGFECEFNPTVTLEDDLKIRDVTMNAIAYDVATETFIDPFGGRSDINAGIIKAVSKHFAEDPLRVLRVARFAARYNFTVDNDTLLMMQKIVNDGELTHLSSERIFMELTKAMGEPYPVKFLNVLTSVNALGDAFGVSEKDISIVKNNAKLLSNFHTIDERIMFLFHNVSDCTFYNFNWKFNLPSDMKTIMKHIKQHTNIAQLQRNKDVDGIFNVFKRIDIMRRPYIFTQMVTQLCIGDINNTRLYVELIALMYTCRNAVSNVDVLSYNLTGIEIKTLLDSVLKQTITDYFGNKI